MVTKDFWPLATNFNTLVTHVKSLSWSFLTISIHFHANKAIFSMVTKNFWPLATNFYTLVTTCKIIILVIYNNIYAF